MNATAAIAIIQRPCKCCGELFAPPRTRPGQVYKFGHKMYGAGGMKRATAKPHLVPAIDDTARRKLDYKLALASARTEQKALDAVIDKLDDQIEMHRKAIAELQAAKDVAVKRHLVVSTAMTVLDCAAEGRDLPIEN